jgi:hypothetical protein
MVTFGSVASSCWPYSYLRAAKRPVNRRSSGTPYRHPRHAELTQVTARHPHLAAALWRETLIDGSIFREWIVNVGRRAALPRMAHLLIEVHERLEAIGRTRGGEFSLPITQIDLGDCLGLSVVHTNRTLQALRGERLVETDRSGFNLLDQERLKELAGFDRTYLHLTSSG